MEKADNISQIISLIFTVRQAFHEKVEGKCCKASLLHIITLRFIEAKKPLMKEIADYLAITPPSATALINNFIKAGIARRELNSKDRRAIKIAITEKGKKYLKDNVRQASSRMRKNLETLSKNEQEQLSKILKKVSEAYRNN